MNINKAYQLITEKLISWLHELFRLLPNIILSAIVLALGFFVAKLVKRNVAKLINRVSIHAALNNLLVSIIYLTCVGLTIFTVLSILHLDTAVTSLLAGAGILGLALAFAFQDIAGNFISGIFISFRNPIHVGDIVQIKDYMGKVEEINLRDTVIRTFQGQLVIIPNRDVFQNPIENYSMLGKRRMDLNVGVSYGEDLAKVKRITLAAVEDLAGLCPEEAITMFYTDFADSSINYMLRIWVSTVQQVDFMEVRSQAIMRIKIAYDENDIMIPFPIRTLDFGIKGGVPLIDIEL